jgi:hypothetical protein
MFEFVLRLFRMIWLCTRGHQALVLENLALRQQLAIYKRQQKRPRLSRWDRLFWIALNRSTAIGGAGESHSLWFTQTP